MPFNVQCLHCGKTILIDDAYAGYSLACPQCGHALPTSIGGHAPPVIYPESSPSQLSGAPAPSVYPVTHPVVTRSSYGKPSKRKRPPLLGRPIVIIALAATAIGIAIIGGGYATRGGKISAPGTPGTSPQADTFLSRMGYRPGNCLICGEPRTPHAIQRHSDKCGYGLCENCGAGLAAAQRVAEAGDGGHPYDQRVAQAFFQIMQVHLQSNPSEPKTAMFMSILTFNSEGWNSLYGPINKTGAK